MRLPPAEDFDPYRVLGVPVGATEREIKRRYRHLVRRFHPDVSGSAAEAHERFVRIAQAYQILSDPQRRAAYDRRAGLEVRVSEAETPVWDRRERVPQLLAEARELVAARRLRRAKQLCVRALELDPLNAEAYEVLGDVFFVGGQREVARDMYEEAKRLGVRPRRAEHRTERPLDQSEEEIPDLAPVSIRWILVVGGAACVLVSLFVFRAMPERPVPLGFSWPPIVTGLVDGFVLGITLAAAGALGSFDDELVAESLGLGEHELPLGLLLGTSGLLSPLLALSAYGIHAIMQGGVSRPVLLAFGCTFAVGGALLVAGRDQASVAHMVWPGLNVIFISLLVGWAIGSIWRPTVWWQR